MSFLLSPSGKGRGGVERRGQPECPSYLLGRKGKGRGGEEKKGVKTTWFVPEKEKLILCGFSYLLARKKKKKGKGREKMKDYKRVRAAAERLPSPLFLQRKKKRGENRSAAVRFVRGRRKEEEKKKEEKRTEKREGVSSASRVAREGLSDGMKKKRGKGGREKNAGQRPVCLRLSASTRRKREKGVRSGLRFLYLLSPLLS